MSWIGGIGNFDIRFPVAGPGGFGFPGWGGVGGSYSPGQYTRGGRFSEWAYGVAVPPAITASRELPGRTHWDPNPADAVGGTSAQPAGDVGVVFTPGEVVPILGVLFPDDGNESQSPAQYIPPPILLPGQVDPGREEHEDEEVAHTWLHLGSQVIGGLFPDQNPLAYGLSGYAPGNAPGTLGPFDPGATTAVAPGGAGPMSYTGSCPPRKTRTLTIDCATGQEVKRKRRRRRALLTQGDMGVLFQIASLPNNANVRVALAGAIRR